MKQAKIFHREHSRQGPKIELFSSLFPSPSLPSTGTGYKFR